MCATRVSMQNSNASVLWDMARAFCDDSFTGEHHKRLSGMIRARSVSGICSYDLPDPEYHGQDFVNIRQLQAFFKKNAHFSEPTTCAQTARNNFLHAETICRITNRRLDWFYTRRERLAPDLRLNLERCESFIRGALGDLNSFINRIPELVKVTGGATEDRPRSKALPFLKISRKLRVTPGSVPLVESYLRYVGNRKQLRITATPYNRIVFVPKNYKTYRTIACEPTATLPFQLAFDSHLKQRLRRYGCDLRSQTLNQELARLGSIDQSYATIDLSMASDTLSLNAVAWLLPDEWFTFLMRLRCSAYQGEVGTGRYAKFSSMGNGVTFALETLVFLACIRAVGSTGGTTYGDDLIVETHLVEPLMRLLQFLGFSVNVDKSFTHGPFRESCGADWLKGKLVTPFYIRKLPKARSELCHVINGLRRIATPEGALWRLLSVLSVGLPLVPESEDSSAGIHVSYEYCRELGLIVNNTSLLGPWVPACKQLVQVSDKTPCHDARSFVLYLLFRGRIQTGYVRQSDGTFEIIEPSDLTMWDVGTAKRKLKFAPCRPWSRSSVDLDLWSEYLKDQRAGRRH